MLWKVVFLEIHFTLFQENNVFFWLWGLQERLALTNISLFWKLSLEYSWRMISFLDCKACKQYKHFKICLFLEKNSKYSWKAMPFFIASLAIKMGDFSRWFEHPSNTNLDAISCMSKGVWSHMHQYRTLLSHWLVNIAMSSHLCNQAFFSFLYSSTYGTYFILPLRILLASIANWFLPRATVMANKGKSHSMNGYFLLILLSNNIEMCNNKR